MSQPTMLPAEFQRKWIATELKERSASQSHFNDLCAVLGVPTPTDADPKGEFYAFERGASKLRGGEGWADVWYRNHFAWEYKGKRANLKAAYEQLAQYREDLENPPLLIVSDLNRIEVHTNFTGTVKRVYAIDLATFAEPESLRVLRAVFDDPDSLKPTQTVVSVTEEAARSFGTIAAGLRSRGAKPDEAAHFLMQLLFCLFAEDIGILRNKVFSRLLEFGQRLPFEFSKQVHVLLTAMADGGYMAFEVIPQFNGGLFAKIHVFDLTPEEIGVLADAAKLDWSAIEPAIFGTLFERSLDPAKRSQLGAHYTGRRDIERVVDPVVMTPLRRRWDAVRTELDTIRAASEAAPTPTRRRNQQEKFAQVQGAFLHELASVRVLDPACGSGNFLYVAMGRLLELEKEVIRFGAEAGLPVGIPNIRPSQMLGMEIDPLARELAQVAIWIGYLQWMIANGFGWTEPVLETLETIRLQDALLTESDGRVSETVWPAADYIIGNPPFLGGKRLRDELGDDYVDTLFAVYRGQVTRESDLCCYFFERARGQVERDEADRAGLLATNSIRGGANREVLKRIKQTGDIYMAWDDEPWILDGAAVRISIVGFDDGSEDVKHLDGEPVASINSDLTSTTDVTHAAKLKENIGIAFMGDTKGGAFDIPNDLAQQLLAMPVNPNGRPNSNVVRPWINGMDITRRPRNMWIIDFGVDMPEHEVALYEGPFEYVRQHVKPIRETNKRQSYRERWWLHVEPRSGWRDAQAGLTRFLVTPRVATYRSFVWRAAATLPDSATIAFAREDDYFFGVLHSRAHEVWSLRMGTSLEDRPRYTPTTCFETFPLPWPPGCEPVEDPRVVAIGEAAKALNELRENWLNLAGASEAELKKRTLTNLYNARPQWLRNAHAALDRAVWDAYGWDDPDPATVDEDTILSRLLALNLERSAETV
jgi:type II restriction/modification system DNA methylase subunit YeeA